MEQTPYNPDGISALDVYQIQEAINNGSASVEVDGKVFRIVSWNYSSRVGFIETEITEMGSAIIQPDQINY